MKATADARTVLNLFSYTCAFSVAAAMGGALTTSVDLSKRYLEWGRENFRANQIDLLGHEFYAGDVFDRLGLFAERKRRFDLVIVDPPTFSRDGEGGTFRVDRDYHRLADARRGLGQRWRLPVVLDESSWFSPRRTEARPLLGPRFILRLDDVAMPLDFTGEQYLQSVWAQRTD